jgi:hypothetical protein
MSDSLLSRTREALRDLAVDYASFLNQKAHDVPPSGFEPGPLVVPLFDWQADLVRWAIRRGRAALFADTGLGKTRMQIEWARQVSERASRPILILAPLAVAEQTRREGADCGVEISHSKDGTVNGSIVITNYERLHRFDVSRFAGIVLDESSILKSFDGKTRTELIETFKATPFRLCCTATPSPNDHSELGNHAEFLGIMSRTEMLAEFFCYDGGETAKWRLKGHAFVDFWNWVSTWAATIRKPSDLGYEDGAFLIPPLVMHEHVVKSAPQKESAREHEDERHICPLQLEVIRRGVRLWSNPGDVVLSPFAGIGSEGFVAIQEGRKYVGVELKGSYYGQAVLNLKAASSVQCGLFDASEPAA